MFRQRCLTAALAAGLAAIDAPQFCAASGHRRCTSSPQSTMSFDRADTFKRKACMASAELPLGEISNKSIALLTNMKDLLSRAETHDALLIGNDIYTALRDLRSEGAFRTSVDEEATVVSSGAKVKYQSSTLADHASALAAELVSAAERARGGATTGTSSSTRDEQRRPGRSDDWDEQRDDWDELARGAERLRNGIDADRNGPAQEGSEDVESDSSENAPNRAEPRFVSVRQATAERQWPLVLAAVADRLARRREDERMKQKIIDARERDGSRKPVHSALRGQLRKLKADGARGPEPKVAKPAFDAFMRRRKAELQKKQKDDENERDEEVPARGTVGRPIGSVLPVLLKQKEKLRQARAGNPSLCHGGAVEPSVC